MHATARLQKLFTEGFRALDLAEPLPSFDADRDAAEMRRSMEAMGTSVAGLRTSGHVRGYALAADLDSGTAADRMRPFAEGQVLTDEAGLPAALEVLDREEYCFIATLGTVDAIVTRGDIDKPAARMWLFGNLTIIEMVMSLAIDQRFAGETWRESVSEERLRKAGDLLAERRRLGHRVSLLDCLQLGDKVQILLKEPEFITEIGFPSRRAAKELTKRLQSLRNSLAHSQEILADDWPAIARLALRLPNLMARLTRGVELVDRAKRFAMDAHGRIDHRRKYTNEPYWVHLEAVASMVREVTRDPEVLAAAWLHDTVEDTPVTIDEITERFGERVARIVGGLTDCSGPSDGNRAQRKALDCEHTARACPEAKTIKLADLIDNVRSIAERDPKFGRVYVAEMRLLLEVLGEADERLLERARATLEQAHEQVSED